MVDTGFGPSDAAARGRRLVRSSADALATIGVDAATASDVILTHLHYDHVGGFDQFPAARFHLQDREMAFATGRQMTRPALSHAFTAEHVADLVLAVHERPGRVPRRRRRARARVCRCTTSAVTPRPPSGAGRTERGWLVLASDATHYYENIETGRPFPIVFDVGAMLDGYDTLRRLADSPEAIVPGHDPLVFDRFPVAAPGLEGIAVSLEPAV